MKSKIGLFSLCLFAASFCVEAQSDSSWFSAKIVNKSNNTLYINFVEQLDSVKPKTETNFRRKINRQFFPFTCFFGFHNSGSDDKFISEYILSDTTKREVRVSQNDSITFISNHSEKLLEYYENNYTEANFVKLSDSIINLNLNDIASAAVIARSYCTYGVEKDTILKLFNLLSDNIKKSLVGNYVSRYIEGLNKLKENNIFVDFSLPDTAFKKVKLSSVRSEYILLDFWFSSCGPCIESFPELIQFYNKTKREKFQVIGLTIDSQKLIELWKSTLLKNQIPWINVRDVDYKIYTAYSIGICPTKIFLDKNLKIIKINPTISELEKIVKDN